jgi:hypothetical protein
MWLLATVVTLFALARTKFPVGNSPLTQIHFGECSLVAPAFPSSFVRSIGSFDGGIRESEVLS